MSNRVHHASAIPLRGSFFVLFLFLSPVAPTLDLILDAAHPGNREAGGAIHGMKQYGANPRSSSFCESRDLGLCLLPCLVRVKKQVRNTSEEGHHTQRC